jgi:integrase
MSVYRQRGTKFYTMDFWFNGIRFKESTKVSTLTMARTVERNRKRELEEGRAGVKKAASPQMFKVVAEEFMALRELQTEGMTRGKANTVRIDRYNLEHLKPFFGKKLLCDITPMDIALYQKKRIHEGAAPKTVNLEIATLRSIATRGGHWARLVPEIEMLKVDEKYGFKLTDEQSDAIFEGCRMSDSRMLYPYVMMCHETGARSGVIKSLQWERIDFARGGLRFGRDKTKAGSHRTIPISNRAIATLEVWAENFPRRRPKDYVFPSEVYKLTKGGDMVVVSSDLTRHVTSLRRSWETALERAAWILAGKPDLMEDVEFFECRFHDLRHNAVSRMIANKVPIPIIAQLVGWSPTTMWEMAQRYGHYDMETLREAVEGISGDAQMSGPPKSPTNRLAFPAGRVC